MTREQILRLLRDYCRSMVYAGKTIGEVESFLHVLRPYLHEREVDSLLQNVRRLIVQLAYSPLATENSKSTQGLRHFPTLIGWGNRVAQGLGLYFLVAFFLIESLSSLHIGFLAIITFFWFAGFEVFFRTLFFQRRKISIEELRVWQSCNFLANLVLLSAPFVVPIFLPAHTSSLYAWLAVISFFYTPFWLNALSFLHKWETKAVRVNQTLQATISNVPAPRSIVEPEHVIKDFIEFFEEEKRNRQAV